MKKVVWSRSIASPKARALVSARGTSDSRRSRSEARPRKNPCPASSLRCAAPPARTACLRSSTCNRITRSCSTLLCLRLCSSAPGTTSAAPARNTAVPATRSGVLSARSRNSLERQGPLRMSLQMHAPAQAPGVHHHEHGGRDGERQPAAFDDLERIGGEEGEIDQSQAAPNTSECHRQFPSAIAWPPRWRPGRCRSPSRRSPRCHRPRPARRSS